MVRPPGAGHSGVRVTAGQDAGRFAFAAGVAVALVSGVVGAWTFLTRAGVGTTDV